jgi:hypothetical protein
MLFKDFVFLMENEYFKRFFFNKLYDGRNEEVMKYH